MKFTVQKEDFLQPLTLANSIVQKKQTLAILSNLLLEVKNNRLKIVSTDLELEFETTLPLDQSEEGQVTVPARKLFDIVRTHPDGTQINLSLKDNHVQVRSNSRRFLLNTMSVEDFPSIRGGKFKVDVDISTKSLKELIDATSFSIAQQDVRYYLNGLFIDMSESHFRVVATDGHRMAVAEATPDKVVGETQGIIVPRKCIFELNRLLNDPKQNVAIHLNNEFIEFNVNGNRLISRLIDGNFPDYQNVIPKDGDQTLIVDRLQLRDAVNRVSVLSNENYKSVEFNISKESLKLKTNNTDQDEAEEELETSFSGDSELSMGFNCSYIVDVLNAMKAEKVKITLKDANSGCLLEEEQGELDSQYVVMPMRL